MCPLGSRGRRNAVNLAPLNEGLITTTAKRNLADSEINTDVSDRSPVQDIRLRKLLQLIEADPLGTIHDWALAFNLSNSHLQHLFKQATGMALGQALTEKRLQRAAHLLANTNMSVKEIACAVGYEHTSSFTRAFERRFEQGPRRYRMENAA
jgi:AraC-like DNA-binding protein